MRIAEISKCHDWHGTGHASLFLSHNKAIIPQVANLAAEGLSIIRNSKRNLSSYGYQTPSDKSVQVQSACALLEYVFKLCI